MIATQWIQQCSLLRLIQTERNYRAKSAQEENKKLAKLHKKMKDWFTHY